jgi:hypothetical protein
MAAWGVLYKGTYALTIQVFLPVCVDIVYLNIFGVG